jgi:hypothetical protein
MVGKRADSTRAAYGGALHLVFGSVFAVIALFAHGDDRSLMAGLAFYFLAVGGAWSYFYHRPEIRAYLRQRRAAR